MSNYKIDDFDYIRLTTTDINGCHLTKLISSKQYKRILENEVNIVGQVFVLGIRTQYVEMEEFVENKTRNTFMFPDMETLVPIQWADTLGFKVGELICDINWGLNDPAIWHPRYVAQRQLAKLGELGFELYSAFEPEFRVFKPNSFEPFTLGSDLSKTSLHAIYEPYFMEATQLLEKAGIPIQDCSVEHGEGQLEMPLIPYYGIKSADLMFRFKQGIREIGKKHGMTVSFMTQPIENEESSSSGNHFNHSLRKKEKTGNDALIMFDSNDPDNLSTITRHWLGGLMKHFGALSAFCCPTTNCYRRLHKFLTPTHINWDIDDRFCSVRVKNFNPKLTYIENRLPSSAANPYLVLAATVAAGIDGLVNKIEPPPKGSKISGTIPKTLQEALDVLEGDTVLTEALGGGKRGIVKYFCDIKRNVDLAEVPTISGPMPNDIAKLCIDAERRLYFDFV